MEEDAGKSLHDGFADSVSRTYIDLNRCGTPLLEIVSPSPTSAAPPRSSSTSPASRKSSSTPASATATWKRARCAATPTSASCARAQPSSAPRPRSRTSTASATSAPPSSTRSSARSASSKTAAASGRSRASGTAPRAAPTPCGAKEQAHDYRYFPEPDLPALVVGAAWQAEILKAFPELPEARRARMIAAYGISEQDAFTFTATRAFADQFEAAAKRAKSPRRVASLLTSEITMRLRAAELKMSDSPHLAKTASSSPPTSPNPASSPAKCSKTCSTPPSPTARTSPPSTTAKSPSKSPTPAAIEAIIDEVIAANPKQVEQFKAGKRTVAAFFVGQVMKASKGQANPALLNDLVTKKLDASIRGTQGSRGSKHGKDKSLCFAIRVNPREIFRGRFSAGQASNLSNASRTRTLITLALVLPAAACMAPGHPMPPNTVMLSQMMRELSARPASPRPSCAKSRAPATRRAPPSSPPPSSTTCAAHPRQGLAGPRPLPRLDHGRDQPHRARRRQSSPAETKAIDLTATAGGRPGATSAPRAATLPRSRPYSLPKSPQSIDLDQPFHATPASTKKDLVSSLATASPAATAPTPNSPRSTQSPAPRRRAQPPQPQRHAASLRGLLHNNT